MSPEINGKELARLSGSFGIFYKGRNPRVVRAGDRGLDLYCAGIDEFIEKYKEGNPDWDESLGFVLFLQKKYGFEPGIAHEHDFDAAYQVLISPKSISRIVAFANPNSSIQEILEPKQRKFNKYGYLPSKDFDFFRRMLPETQTLLPQNFRNP